MSSSQKNKTKFRATSGWKKFRKQLKEERKLDAITGKPLYKGFQVHHLDLDESHYEDISDPERFATLNRQSHDFIHWAYKYYCKDPEFINRFTDLLKRMKDINE